MSEHLISGRLMGLLGNILVTISLLMIPAIILSIIDGDPAVTSAFTTASLISSLFGILFIFTFFGAESTGKMTTAMAGSILASVVIAFFCGLPSILLSPDTSLIMGFFDGMSAFTTMGVTSYPNIDGMPRALTLWISIVGWLGGFASIMMVLSILTACNSGGMQMHVSPLSVGAGGGFASRMYSAGRVMFPIYAGLTLSCYILLWMGPMGAFQALVRAMGAISTSGVYLPDSGVAISGFYTQLIMVIFMLVGMFNLDYHYAWFKGQRQIYRQDSESNFLWRILILALFLFFSLAIITGAITTSYIQALWESFFIVVSAASTTGIMPDSSGISISIPMMIILMVLASIGGEVASTSGGLKTMRMSIVIRQLINELRRLAHPHGVNVIRFAKMKIASKDMEAVWLLGSSFLAMIAAGTLMLAVLGLDLQEALSMAIAATTTSGALVEVLAPTFPGFSGLAPSEYIILSFLMFFGKFETTLLMGLLVRQVWRR